MNPFETDMAIQNRLFNGQSYPIRNDTLAVKIVIESVYSCKNLSTICEFSNMIESTCLQGWRFNVTADGWHLEQIP